MNKYYFTFGSDSFNAGKCQIIQASCELYARAKMFQVYGNKFCTSYDEETWSKMKNDSNRKYPLEIELPQIIVVFDDEAKFLIENGVFDKPNE